MAVPRSMPSRLADSITERLRHLDEAAEIGALDRELQRRAAVALAQRIGLEEIGVGADDVARLLAQVGDHLLGRARTVGGVLHAHEHDALVDAAGTAGAE